MRLVSRRLINSQHSFLTATLLIIVAVAVPMVVFAATRGIGFEVEDGQLASQAAVLADTNASGGDYVRFGGGTAFPILLTSKYLTGVTYTHDTFNSAANATAVANGKTLLNNSSYFYNVHVMGFGPGNPSPSPGVYSWGGLDSRINDTMAEGDAIVLTACCSPGWMKNAPDFGTDPNGKLYVEYAPLPEYYDEYATLIAEAVRRYPTIKYVQVWNEMKGFWDSTKQRWNHEGYTQMYNLIWDKVKAVRSTVKIGGPYVVAGSNGAAKTYSSTVGGAWGKFDKRDLDVVTYWLQNKKGADFITIDAKNTNRDGVELVDQFARTDKYRDFNTWLRSLDPVTYPGAATLPLWWAEWYNRSDNDTDSHALKNALMATALIRTIKTGSETALHWGPEGTSSGISAEQLALFTATENSGGGQATLFHAAQKMVHDNFSAGTVIYNVPSSNNNVEVLASASKIMLVNRTSTAQSTTIKTTSISLNPYEVKLVDMPAN